MSPNSISLQSQSRERQGQLFSKKESPVPVSPMRCLVRPMLVLKKEISELQALATNKQNETTFPETESEVKHSKWNWECDSGLGSVSKKEVIVALASL